MSDAPVTPIRSATSGKKYPLTEAGNSERFADMFGDRVIYVEKWKGWMVYETTHWVRDFNDVRVLGLAKESNRAVIREAGGDKREFEAYLDWAQQSERMANRTATVKGARSEVTLADPEEFDRDPMLLNFQNGTLDLTTATLREHRATDRITRVLPYAYDPDAKCPRFDVFLYEVLQDPATIEYLWRIIGYLLTGSTTEHSLFFFWGKGRNGKTTLIKLLLSLLGPYADQGMKGLLLSKRNEGHPVEFADLKGKRLVALVEINDNQHWDAATTKWLTGGDRMKGRGMHENPYSWEPTHKLIIAANAKPFANANDEALFARIKLLAFLRSFDGAARDASLLQKLEAEIPGILAKAVRACLRWQAEGLGEPAAVTEAVASYRREVDPLAGFFDGRARGEQERVTRADLRVAYEEWARARGEEPMSPQAFTRRVRVLDGVTEGKVKDRAGNPRDGWRGIGGPVVSSESVEADRGYFSPTPVRERELGENGSYEVATRYERKPGEDDGDEGGSS